MSAFAAAGLSREVAFEVTTTDFMVRLVGEGLCVAMLPASYAARFTGVTTIEVTDAAARVEYAVSGVSRTPAAAAFLSLIDPG